METCGFSTRRLFYWKVFFVLIKIVSVEFVVARLKFWRWEINDSHDPDSLNNNFVIFIFWINRHKIFIALMRNSFGLKMVYWMFKYMQTTTSDHKTFGLIKLDVF